MIKVIQHNYICICSFPTVLKKIIQFLEDNYFHESNFCLLFHAVGKLNTVIERYIYLSTVVSILSKGFQRYIIQNDNFCKQKQVEKTLKSLGNFHQTIWIWARVLSLLNVLFYISLLNNNLIMPAVHSRSTFMTFCHCLMFCFTLLSLLNYNLIMPVHSSSTFNYDFHIPLKSLCNCRIGGGS